MKYCIAFLLFSAPFALAGTGKLTGIVTDEHGIPEKHLMLEACPLDVPMMGVCPEAETDREGRFEMRISLGRWAVHPLYDPSPGGSSYYPPDRVPFYKTMSSHPDVREVDVTPESPDAVVEIRLGAKAGAVVGRVTDAATGLPIKPYATVAMAWASNPTIFMGANTESAGWIDPVTGEWKYRCTVEGKYRLLVPADTALTLSAMTIAKGYKPYRYQGVITVESGQQKVVDIQLQPEDK